MNISTLSFAALLFLAGVSPAVLAADQAVPKAAPAAPERSGTVKQVQGEVTVSNAQGRRVLKPGDAVAVADQLSTGTGSAASVVLRDGTTLMMGPDSRLDIQGFAYDANSHEGNVFLSVLRGTMRMITGLIGKMHPEAVKINTPTSLIGVLGTDFIVKAEGTP